MKRLEFLKGLGAVSLGSMLPLHRTLAAAHPDRPLPAPPTCLLSPAVPQGPFYLNTGLFRNDITEGLPGIPMSMVLTVVNADCVPIPNAIVDVWHCDKDGIYSGFSSQGTAGQTFLRGMQTTDANGQVQFTSIYPGWYPGRLTHLHVKIHFDNSTYVTTNLFYPAATNQVVYADALYAANGQNPVTVAQDVELSGDVTRYNELMSTLTPDGNGGYIQSYTFGINVLSVGVNAPVGDATGQFTLTQNFPNPVTGSTNITFTLLGSSMVRILVLDMQGRTVEVLAEERMGAGEHRLHWDARRGDGSRLAPGNYTLQMVVTNNAGEFRQTKVMNVQ
jgi:protocatechuate 3,4-dioxygenase beta subunit